jgi:hypothetical protein
VGGEPGQGALDAPAAKPPSAKTKRIGLIRYAESRLVLAPSRSCTLAVSTTTTMSRPKVSVTMNRFLPLIF